MKKMFWIFGTGKRKAWAAILFCVMTLILSTVMAFAVSANVTTESDQATQVMVTVPISPEEQAALDRRIKEEKALDYSEYAAYGMTYDIERDLFLFDGKVVRYFYDEGVGRGFTYNKYDAVNHADYNKSVDLTAIRDASRELTGLTSASKEDFDRRTARSEEIRAQSGQYASSDVAVQSLSICQSTPDNSRCSASAVQSNRNVSEVDYAWSYDPNYVDTSLNAYADYGVSYDAESKGWMFNQKVIALLIDAGHQTFVNLPADDTGGDYTEAVATSKGAFLKVTRKADGVIDKVVEMAVDEAAKTLNTLFVR